MGETKPTVAALRAAKEIGLKTIIRSEDNVVVSYASITQVAHIIDRETAGPKVEELVEEIIRIHKGWGYLGWKAPPAMRKILAKAREVEAALKGSSADTNSHEVRKARGAQ